MERPQSPEELAIIQAILESLPDFLDRYGRRPIPVTPDHLHFLDLSKIDELLRAKILKSRERGFYVATEQILGIIPEASCLRTAEAIVHELLHLHSYASLVSSGDEFIPRRIGFRMFSADGGDVQFADLDEAIIEELTIRFDRALFSHIPALAQEVEKRATFSTRVSPNAASDISAVTTLQQTNGDWVTTVFEYAYPEERARLWDIIDSLYEKNHQFESREDVFELFAKAALTGHVLQLARLIERTFGTGSFRRLGASVRSTDAAPQEDPRGR